jgi:predicted DNA-binding protein (UPF0251 family)
MQYSQCNSCHKLFPLNKLQNGLHRCGLGRKKKERVIQFTKTIPSTIFKPQGKSVRQLKIISLNKDELEALKLKNIQNLHQTDIADKMSVSQSTLARILKEVNRKITLALINGWGIEIK